jgi:hypothetical protein
VGHRRVDGAEILGRVVERVIGAPHPVAQQVQVRAGAVLVKEGRFVMARADAGVGGAGSPAEKPLARSRSPARCWSVRRCWCGRSIG